LTADALNNLRLSLAKFILHGLALWLFQIIRVVKNAATKIAERVMEKICIHDSIFFPVIEFYSLTTLVYSAKVKNVRFKNSA
jgi:hypothetical protein